MSYKFGQLRRSQINSYMTTLSYTVGDIKTESDLSKKVVFIDKGIFLSDGTLLQSRDNAGKNIKSYYLQFKVYKQEKAEQLLTIKLKDTNKTKDNEQTLTSITVEPGFHEDYSIFEFVIQPNQNYNQIHFILNRVVLDYNTENEDGSYGRKVNIEIVKLKEIYNVIDFLNPAIENKGQLKQIGVQAEPGLLMSIDGEAIKVGRSGLYEINNGFIIKHIGFIVEPEDNQYFLLDYQY